MKKPTQKLNEAGGRAVPPGEVDHLLRRRAFLKMTSATAMLGGGLFSGRRLFAGDDLAADAATLYRRVIPGRKGLAAGWVRSLVVRDAPDDAPVVSADKEHLPHIGMTVGGIGAGTMYLTGDGRLAVWDIFNRHHEGVVPNRAEIPGGMENLGQAGPVVRERDGANYVSPPTLESHPVPFRKGFVLDAGGVERALDSSGFESVSFRGDWPVGRVEYADAGCPVRVRLAAWSPFIPLDVENSTLPVTVMEYELENTGSEEVRGNVAGILENPVCHQTAAQMPVPKPRTAVLREAGVVMLAHRPGVSEEDDQDVRPDILFDDFERDTYAPWVAEGTAFGAGPVAAEDVPEYQGDLGLRGSRVVNSHASAPGASANQRDAATGTLTSPEFVIERNYITFLLGGGNHPGLTGVELLVDGEVVASVTGRNANRMEPATIGVRDFDGKTARLRIVDRAEGGWGHVGVDHVVFSDQPPASAESIEERGDYGTMVLAALDGGATPGAAADDGGEDTLRVPFALEPGGKRRITFVIAWHFPNLAPLPGLGRRRPHYAVRYEDASAVARDVVARIDALRERTFCWVETWYDSTLPRWLMDRAVVTANTLQTSNCYFLEDGRFWAWEGVGCCAGTCNHVWHYAQSIARLFPPFERALREKVDFGVAMNEDGGVRYRGEAGATIAVDGQAAVVLRTWREHLCSADDAFLKRVWPGARRALEWLIRFDENDPDGGDGLLHGRQHNTLDAEWYGKVHCLSSLYLAALRAGEAMAAELGEDAFAARCRRLLDLGAVNIEALFNGEYYEQIEDPAHANAIGVGPGCYIDQVIGQWWATQTGLGRLYNADHIRSALHALWKYNFVPHVDTFRQTFKRGRFYALDDEAGLIMCTWPKGGLREDFMRHWQYGYFNECMTGFEYQAAAHMVQEGSPVDVGAVSLEEVIENPDDPRALTLRGLAITRAIHDRYAPSRRNPYNEIECSDHYARAAAGYSVFLAMCGFRHHGPNGELGFAPKTAGSAFKVPFTTAEAWGSYAQSEAGGSLECRLDVKHGDLMLKRLYLGGAEGRGAVAARLGGQEVSAAPAVDAGMAAVDFDPPLHLGAGDILEISLS